MSPIFATLAAYEIVRDWTIEIAGLTFGVLEMTWTGDDAWCFIYYGPGSFKLNTSAPTLLGIGVPSLLVLALGITYIITHFRAKPVQAG